MLEMLQESFQRERRQMKAVIMIMMVILIAVVMAFVVVGVSWMKSRYDVKTIAEEVKISEEASARAQAEKEAEIVVKRHAEAEAKREKLEDKIVPVETTVSNAEAETPAPQPAKKQIPLDETVTLVMPQQVANPATIPGYKDSRLMLVTERGVGIPWLIIVPEKAE
jgi:hypothetical protein